MTELLATPSTRIGYLESIRGLAAVQVLLLHCLAAFAPNLVFALPASGNIGGYIHLSPLYFFYDGYSAVYVFFTLSGFVLSCAFARRLERPFTAAVARAVRLGLPAMAATLLSAATLIVFGRPNAEVARLLQSDWFAQQWDPDLSVASVLIDGTANALLLGYRGLSNVPFLTPWQQPIEQSFLAPLWTLSTEFYGSLLILLLCVCARKSPALWRVAIVIGAIYFVRSAYLCFFIGHVAAILLRDDVRFSPRVALPAVAIMIGVALCVIADVWQPDWLRWLCNLSTPLLFPGQFPALQQKAGGAVLVLSGIVSLSGAQALLSRPRLVAWAQLSFPLYLVHWPILFGPAALIYLAVKDVAGLEAAAVAAILAGVVLSYGASRLFLPLDRFAQELSRRMCRPLSHDPRLRSTAMITTASEAAAR